MVIPIFPQALGLESGSRMNVAELVLHSGPVVQLVLLILVALSIFSWAIIFYKFSLLRKTKKGAASFLGLFRESGKITSAYKIAKRFNDCLPARILCIGYEDVAKNFIGSEKRIGNPSPDPSPISKAEFLENFSIALKKRKDSEMVKLEKYLTFLATTGSSAPFIGLFGTVWGIMSSFHSIGKMGSVNIAVVAPGISEALIATAVGLFAAIPAVAAYNYFLRQIKVLSLEMENFLEDILAMAKRS